MMFTTKELWTGYHFHSVDFFFFFFYINTVINKEIVDLECQRVSGEERKGTLMKAEKDEMRQQ